MQTRFFKLDHDKLEKIVGVYNIGVALLVLNDYFKQSDADTKEYMFDVTTHLLNGVVGLGLLNLVQARLPAALGNVARIADIVYRAATGTSTIPAIANAVDVLNHAGALAVLASGHGQEQEDKESPATKPRIR